MRFEEYSGKKVTVITEAGYIYSPDRKQKTTDVTIAAEWFNCKEKDLVLIGSYPWTYSAVYFEEDPAVPNAIKNKNSWILEREPLSTQNLVKNHV